MNVNNKDNKEDFIDTPLVSIIIPVFNTVKYINACLDSVLEQTYPNIEIIVIDDGSTDGSSEVLQEYAGEHSNIIIYMHQKNQGLSAARNTGMELAKGEYIYFLDSDDLIDSSMMSTLVTLCVKNELDMILFDAKPYFESDYIGNAKIRTNYSRKESYSEVLVGIEMAESLIVNSDYFASACLFLTKRELISSIELKFPIGTVHEDEVFSFLLMINAKKVMHNPEKLYIRRIRNNSIMASSSQVRSFNGYVSSIKLLLYARREYGCPFQSVITLRLTSLLNRAFSVFHSLSLEEKKSVMKEYKRLRAISFENSHFGIRAGWLMNYCFPLYGLLRNVKKHIMLKLYSRTR